MYFTCRPMLAPVLKTFFRVHVLSEWLSVGRLVSRMATSTTVVREGKAEIVWPNSGVFYNPVQEFNRDLTIAVISQFSKEYFECNQHCKKGESALTRNATLCEAPPTGNEPTVDEQNREDNTPIRNAELVAGVKYDNGIRIFEGLSATGLRSIRFGLEIPGVQEVIANELNQGAVDFIKKNIERNNVVGLVKENHGDAALVMYQNKAFKSRFHVIDLDPYGTAAPFLDAAVQSVVDGGLLCVTCTDTAVLCGNACETCWAKYGAVSLKARFCHEMGLRILLRSIESHANCYSRYIVPLVCISADFYMRVFVKVFTGQGKVKHSLTKMALVLNCTGCGSFVLQRLGAKTPTKGDNFKFHPATYGSVGSTCEHCGFKLHIGGPIWAESISDLNFIHGVLHHVKTSSSKLATADRIEGMLTMIGEELQQVPLYYILDHICNVLHCSPPSLLQIRSAIMNAGYSVSLSHAAKNSIKTDAPNSVLWDIMRAWVEQNPVSPARLTDGTPAKAILDRKLVFPVTFALHPLANPCSRKSGLLRWQINPTKDWGPKPRARRVEETETEMSSSQTNKRARSDLSKGNGDKTEEESVYKI